VLASGDHVVEWTSSTGPVDYTNVYLFEITAPAGATVIEHRFNVTTTLGKATLPAALFVANHTYAIGVENRLGFDATSGDLDVIHYPAALSRTTSFTFQAR
jgi:hypothetical protein